MTNTQSFAKRELDNLSNSFTDPENRPLVEPFKDEILALCEKFGLSGQSGGSAPYVAGAISDAIKKLLLQNPICPIMGTDDEWFLATDNLWQNKRCSALFKNEKGECWYLDAIVWKTEDSKWNGSAEFRGKKYSSRQLVKSFPFTPKTFFVDVTEVETSKDDWDIHIKYATQLHEVFNYYSEYVFNS